MALRTKYTKNRANTRRTSSIRFSIAIDNVRWKKQEKQIQCGQIFRMSYSFGLDGNIRGLKVITDILEAFGILVMNCDIKYKTKIQTKETGSAHHTRKQWSTTIQPQPPSGGSSYWISFSFFFVVMASLPNRFMVAFVSLEANRKINKWIWLLCSILKVCTQYFFLNIDHRMVTQVYSA